MSRLKSWPEMVPVQAMTAKPCAERLELLKRSPSELPTAKSVAPSSTELTPNRSEMNW